jgi:hypothetical protein
LLYDKFHLTFVVKVAAITVASSNGRQMILKKQCRGMFFGGFLMFQERKRCQKSCRHSFSKQPMIAAKVGGV